MDMAKFFSLLLNNCKLAIIVEFFRKIQKFTTLSFKGGKKTKHQNPQQQQ